MVEVGTMQGGRAEIQEISEPTATPWIIRSPGGRRSQEQGGHLHQGAEAQWEEGVRREEGGNLMQVEGIWRVDVEKEGETTGGREGWRIEGRALVATVVDQDMLEGRGDSQKGMEERDQCLHQATALQGVMVRDIPLEVTEERCLQEDMGGKPRQELMVESQPQELMESKGVRGVLGLLHLPRKLLQRHMQSTRQERLQKKLQQKGDSCSKHFFANAKISGAFLAWKSFDIINWLM